MKRILKNLQMRRFSKIHFDKNFKIQHINPEVFYETVKDVSKYEEFIPFCSGSNIVNK